MKQQGKCNDKQLFTKTSSPSYQPEEVVRIGDALVKIDFNSYKEQLLQDKAKKLFFS